MTGIEFLILGLGHTGVPGGGSEESGLGWLGSVTGLALLATTSNLSESILMSNR